MMMDILFSWNHVMPEMFNLHSMHFKEALGATGLLFSAGFLLNSRWSHSQDHFHPALPDREASSPDRSGGDSN
jgi:hypothetical protein